MSEKKQFNVDISPNDLTRVKLDAISLGVSLSDYATVAFQKFLSQSIALRRASFVSLSRKTVGAKIKT